MTTLNIRIPETLAGRLSALAEETGRTKSYYVRKALEDQLDEMEDLYMAMQSLEDVKSGKSKVWSQEDVENDRDMED